MKRSTIFASTAAFVLCAVASVQPASAQSFGSAFNAIAGAVAARQAPPQPAMPNPSALGAGGSWGNGAGYMDENPQQYAAYVGRDSYYFTNGCEAKEGTPAMTNACVAARRIREQLVTSQCQAQFAFHGPYASGAQRDYMASQKANCAKLYDRDAQVETSTGAGTVRKF